MARLEVTRWAKHVFKDYRSADVTPSEERQRPRGPIRARVRAAARRLKRPMEGTAARNMRLMQTLDDAWNERDWGAFERRHARDTVVRWPAQLPTRGIRAHRAEAVQMFKTFPDNRVENHPYKVLFASGDWTCSVARFHGTMRDMLSLPDGRMVAPTGRHFEVDFCTVARWKNGQIVEENLFYDLVSMLKQLGIDP
jgi:ketosteroid isomerase-like protein